jgi:hypothetical protein
LRFRSPVSGVKARWGEARGVITRNIEAMAERGYEVFSGHESFVCRYGWLPKLYEAVTEDSALFMDDDDAIVTLGIGKNMVKSIRFWGKAFGLTFSDSSGTVLPTEFAVKLLDGKRGIDPYLEDVSSLWRLHWMLTVHASLGAWSAAFLDLRDTEITKDNFIELIRGRAVTARGAATIGTVAQHVEIFLRTYDSGRNAATAVLEESLGCPMQELGLLEIDEGAGYSIVKFRRGPKLDLDVRAMAFAVADFWSSVAAKSKTLSMRSLMLDRRSPGVVFRLDEGSMHGHLEALCAETKGLSLREDGAGGIDLVASASLVPHAVLQEFSWH